MKLLSALLILSAIPLLADDLGDDLLAATRKGDLAQVKALLDKGANVDSKTRYNQTPLFFACDRGHLEIAKLLIARGASLNVKDNFYNATPLTWAMEKKNKEITALLIEKGVDPADALRQSIQSNNQELLQLILDKGKTDPGSLSDALQMAESAKKTEMVDALKAKGAKVITFDVDPATMNDYVGTFTDGATTTLDFAIKDGKLNASQQGFNMTATPVAKDTFRAISVGLTLQFVRDNGKVTSLKLPGRGGDTVLKRKEVPAK